MAGHSHEHVVTKPTSNDRVVHNRLVGLFLKVGLPAILKVRSRPLLEFIQFLLGRTNLDTSVDAVGSQRSSPLEIPLIEDACSGK